MTIKNNLKFTLKSAFLTQKMLFIFFMAASGFSLFGQEKPLEYYEANFPKKHAIKLLDETNIVITLDDENVLRIAENYHDLKLLISSQASAFTERQIQFTSFFNIRYVAATAYMPKGNGSFTTVKVSDFKTEKILNDNVFHDDLQAIKFTYPDLVKGSKIELSYTEDVLNPFFLAPVYLQDAFFAEKIRVTLQVPETVKIKIIKFNLENSNVSYKTSTKKGIVTHVWEVDSVPEFESEVGAPAATYYIPHIAFIIESYTQNGQEVPVLRGIQDLYTWYNNLLDSVDFTLTPEIIGVVDSIVKQNKSELMQAKALYNWVRGNIKYIAVEDGLGGFIPDHPAQVSHKRFGDCKGMSCLLATMMRHAGLDARECWIGTRDIPYKYAENYTPFADNHMITALRHNNQWYFLDATDDEIPFGYPSAFIQGKEALIRFGKGKFELVKVPVMTDAQSTITMSDTLVLQGEMLLGSAQMTLTGYDAAFYKGKYRAADDKKRFFKYYLQSGNDKFELVDLPNVEMKDSAVHFHYSYKLPDYARNFDGKYLVNLNMDRLFADAVFEDRKLPLQREYQHSYAFVHYLKIPEGFAVLALPEPKTYSNNLANVNLQYSQENGFVVYKMTVSLFGIMMEAAQAEEWNDIVKQLRKEYRKNVEFIKLN